MIFNRQKGIYKYDKLILVNNMKLGKRKSIFIKTILTFLFMLFIVAITISFLYNSINITKNDYFKLLLSDTFGDNFYINLVEMINKNFNPLNVIELKEVNSNTFSLSNNIYVSNPIVYIYNSNQDKMYKEEYNINPSVMVASYLLSNKLNEFKIDSIFEDVNIKEFSSNNNLDINDAIDIIIKDKLNTYPSLKYIINIKISNDKNTIVKIKDKKYALIKLYANKDNITLLNKLNTILNEKYKGISKIYVDNEYNSAINIDIGGSNNSMKEVLNSIEVFSGALKEVI